MLEDVTFISFSCNTLFLVPKKKWNKSYFNEENSFRMSYKNYCKKYLEKYFQGFQNLNTIKNMKG